MPADRRLFRLVSGAAMSADARTVKDIGYLDLETQKSAEEVSGRDKTRDMRTRLGMTYPTARGGYRVDGDREVNDMPKELQRADRVVGSNHLRFDHEVLQGGTVTDLSQLPTLDMLVVLHEQSGLDLIAETTFGMNKTSEGLQALEGFEHGKTAGDRRILEQYARVVSQHRGCRPAIRRRS